NIAMRVRSGGSLAASGNLIGASSSNVTDLIVASGATLVTLGNNSFNATGNYIESHGALEIDATTDTFAVVPAPSTLSDYFTIEDRIIDGLDATGAGLVRLNAGNVYVTQQSGSIQRGVDQASDGDTIHVQAGTFIENV